MGELDNENDLGFNRYGFKTSKSLGALRKLRISMLK